MVFFENWHRPRGYDHIIQFTWQMPILAVLAVFIALYNVATRITSQKPKSK